MILSIAMISSTLLSKYVCGEYSSKYVLTPFPFCQIKSNKFVEFLKCTYFVLFHLVISSISSTFSGFSQPPQFLHQTPHTQIYSVLFRTEYSNNTLLLGLRRCRFSLLTTTTTSTILGTVYRSASLISCGCSTST